MAVQLWEDSIPPPENPDLTNTVWAIAHSPDGESFVVAVGDRVLLYQSRTFALTRALRAHTGIVHCLTFSKDGKRFASGGADKRVIIWLANGDGEKKYLHTSSIQCLSFNPVHQSLASGSIDDFGIYSTEQSAVSKLKVPARTLCADWSPDGQILALGLYNGAVLLRDKQGAALGEIKRGGPVWCLQFNPVKFETTDNMLTLGCWGEGLCQFKITGGDTYTNVGNDRTLKGADPTVLHFYPSGEMFALGCSDGSVGLYTKDAIYIGPICKHSEWVWGTSVNSIQNVVVSGTNSGGLKAHQVMFPMVHGLYKDRYAYRDQLTDVIIQHLVTDSRVRIRCRDYVKKIALYKERLAVQLTDKIIIYSVGTEDEFDMKYKALKKINYKGECSLLVAGYSNILICHERKMKLVDFAGQQEQEWNFDSFIRYVKMVGGPSGRETVLVGLRNGEVLKIFVDNPFPIQLIKIPSAVRCVDISCDKKRLAVVDEHLNLFVYQVETKDVLFQDTKVTSVAWNSELEDVLAFSKEDNVLAIKTGDFSPITQKLTGIIVGFKNSKVFALQGTNMNTIDVPQSGTLFKFVESKAFAKAYKIACLGVTEQDWQFLGFEALQNKQFEIARKAFIRLKNLKYIELANIVEKESKASAADSIISAEILAYQGNYKEAANALIKAGNFNKAVELYVELKNWDEVNNIVNKAKKLANKEGSKLEAPTISRDIIRMQADWAKRNGDYKGAADLYKAIGLMKDAIEIYGEQGILEPINEICKALDKQRDEDLIRLCGKYFMEKGNYGYAKEAYLRLGDLKGLIELNVAFQRWNEGLFLAKQNPDLNSVFYVPYAEYLVSQGKYDQAQEAYKRANRLDLALKILDSLAHNAVVEKRFKDASYYYWKQALETLSHVKNPASPTPGEVELLKSYDYLKRLAHIYYAYDLVNKYLEEPFQDVIGGALYYNCVFNAACYLLNIMGKMNPPNVSRVYLYYTVGKLGSQQEAYWTARSAFEMLGTMKIPVEWQNAIDLESLKIKSKPFTDKDGISPVCNRCMNANHLVTLNDDRCTFCGHPFVRSFISFDTMPLVEFQPSAKISHSKAMALIKADHPSKRRAPVPQRNDGWQEVVTDNQQTLSMAPTEIDSNGDLFLQKINDSPELTGAENYRPIEVDTRLLQSIRFEEVFVEDLTEYCQKYSRRYFKNMVPEIPLTQCEKCSNIFLLDEYEFAFLEKKCCPFCRAKNEDSDQLMEETE